MTISFFNFHPFQMELLPINPLSFSLLCSMKQHIKLSAVRESHANKKHKKEKQQKKNTLTHTPTPTRKLSHKLTHKLNDQFSENPF